MEISILFVGGPLDGMTAATDGLDDVKVFFPAEERRADAYVRENEVEYHYNPEMSKGMTDKYDAAREFFAGEPLSTLRFDGADEDGEE